MLRQYKGPAIEIQAMIRGFLARRRVQQKLQHIRDERERLAREQAERERVEAERKANELKYNASVRLQSSIRRLLAQRWLKRSKTAIRIQTVARMWLARQHVIIPRLEYQLRMLNVEKQEQLQQVEEWKFEEQKRIHAKYAPDGVKKQSKDKKKQEKERLHQEEMRDFRSENKKLRIEQETLRHEAERIHSHNKDLTRANAKMASNLAELKKAMPKLQGDNEKLMKIDAIFNKKFAQYEGAHEEAQTRFETEQSIRNLVQISAEEVVDHIGKSHREPNPMLIPMIQQAAQRDFKKIEERYQGAMKKIEMLGKELEKEREIKKEASRAATRKNPDAVAQGAEAAAAAVASSTPEDVKHDSVVLDANHNSWPAGGTAPSIPEGDEDEEDDSSVESEGEEEKTVRMSTRYRGAERHKSMNSQTTGTLSSNDLDDDEDDEDDSDDSDQDSDAALDEDGNRSKKHKKKKSSKEKKQKKEKKIKKDSDKEKKKKSKKSKSKD